MGCDALLAAKTFYALESLRFIVNKNAMFGMKSHEKLVKDIDDFHQNFSSKLAAMFFDYTTLVVYGEMRHGKNQASHYNPHLDSCKGRSGSYAIAKQYNPKSILKAGESLFDSKVSWGSSFGGARWYNIAKSGSKTYLPENIYCDMCFSLSHNSSPYIDKYQSEIFALNDASSTYKSFLDFKFETKNPQTIFSAINSQLGFGKAMYSLIKRAIVLKLIDMPYYLRCNNYEMSDTENFILNYSPIEWGNEVLQDKIIKKNSKEEDFEEEDFEEEDFEEGDDCLEQKNEKAKENGEKGNGIKKIEKYIDNIDNNYKYFNKIKNINDIYKYKSLCLQRVS